MLGIVAAMREISQGRVGVGIVVGVLLAVLAFAGAHASAQSTAPKDFKVVAKNTKVKQLDDKTVLYKQSIKSGGEKIGKASLKLTFGKRLKINAVWRLDEGSIKVKGRFKRRGAKSVAPIVDGTGAYKDARGKVTIKEETKRRLREEFDFR